MFIIDKYPIARKTLEKLLKSVEPGEAVKFQILIMFLIGGATGIGVTIAVLAGAYRLTDERHRLRLDRLKQV